MENINLARFVSRVQSLADAGTPFRLVLSHPRHPDESLKNMICTLAEIRREIRLNIIYRHKTRDEAKNYPVAETSERVLSAIRENFCNADLFTGDEAIRLLVSPSGKVKVRGGKSAAALKATLGHDEVRNRIVPVTGNLYLRELGVLNAHFEVKAEMKDKYLQINRYIELLTPFLESLPSGKPIRVTDMGSGKGYLTFALYDHLTGRLGHAAEITGVEARAELADFCNEVAGRCGFRSLRFIPGTILETVTDNPDILIALHACDTATDEAIARGIKAGAGLIVCAPCCHKQVRQAMKAPGPVSAISKHGILAERQAEILTDAIRALLMEAHGYRTAVFEFISPGHTPKNVMIVGQKLRKKAGDRDRFLDQVSTLEKMFGIGYHHLGVLLGTEHS